MPHSGKSGPSHPRSPLINPTEYPRSVTDLTPRELILLTQVLHVNEASSTRRSNDRIKQLIQDLPKRLRSKRLSLSTFGLKPIGLCSLHRPMNSDLLHHTLGLVYREVTTCFKPFDNYPEHVHAPETLILHQLRALRGMWTKPSPEITLPVSSWAYQVDECSGCMLSRVVSNQEAIGGLRAALISRTHVRHDHQARRLMKFVDESINRYPQDEVDLISLTASNNAFGLKQARKACTKASGRTGPGGRGPRHSKAKRYGKAPRAVDNEGGNPSGESPSRSVDTDIIWAVKSVPRTSGSKYSSRPGESRGTEQCTVSREGMDEELTSLHREIDEQIPYRLRAMKLTTCDEESASEGTAEEETPVQVESLDMASMDITDIDEERYALFHDNSSFGSLSSSDGEDE